MGELDIDHDTGTEEGEFEEINMDEEFESEESRQEKR